MSDDSELRCIVIVKREANPELFDDLYRLESRWRSERLRSWATAFLKMVPLSLNGEILVEQSEEKESSPGKDNESVKQRNSMIGSVGSSTEK